MPSAYKYINKLRGARVLVVGGTSGIGFAVAEAAVEHGARVVITGSNPDKLRKAIDRLQSSFDLDHSKTSGEADTPPTGMICDLANSSDLEANLEQALQFATDNGRNRLNHVVFTAGDGFERRELRNVDVEHITHAYLIRATAPVILAKLLLPRYIHHEPASSYTLTGGVNGEKPSSNWTVPAGFSSAVEGYTHALSVDMKPLRVNCVAPGIVHTDMLDRLPVDDREQLFKSFREATLTDTIGRPEDLAEAYLYCMKDAFVAGSTIKSNGGRLLV